MARVNCFSHSNLLWRINVVESKDFSLSADKRVHHRLNLRSVIKRHSQAHPRSSDPPLFERREEFKVIKDRRETKALLHTQFASGNGNCFEMAVKTFPHRGTNSPAVPKSTHLVKNRAEKKTRWSAIRGKHPPTIHHSAKSKTGFSITWFDPRRKLRTGFWFQKGFWLFGFWLFWPDCWGVFFLRGKGVNDVNFFCPTD